MKRKRPSLSSKTGEQKLPMAEEQKKVKEFPIVEGQFDDASSPERGQFEDAPEDVLPDSTMKSTQRIRGIPIIDNSNNADGKAAGDEVKSNVVSFEETSSSSPKGKDDKEPAEAKLSKTPQETSTPVKNQNKSLPTTAATTTTTSGAATSTSIIQTPTNTTQNTSYSSTSLSSATAGHQSLSQPNHPFHPQQLQHAPPGWSRFPPYYPGPGYASGPPSGNPEMPLSSYWEAYINRQTNEMRAREEWMRANQQSMGGHGMSPYPSSMEGHMQMPPLSDTRRIPMEYEGVGAPASMGGTTMPPLNQATPYSPPGMPPQSNDARSRMNIPQQHQQQQQPVPQPNQLPIFPSDITLNDVLLGRGGGTNRHNTHFREIVAEAQPQYVLARKKDKTRIAKSIVAKIRSRRGRFLKMNEDGYYFDVGDKQATLKTSQALREGLSGRMREIVKMGGSAAAVTTTAASGTSKGTRADTDTENTASEKDEDKIPHDNNSKRKKK